MARIQADSEIVNFQLRLPSALARQVEQRMSNVGERSRNAWIIRALAWALEQPPRETNEKVRT